ncbi:efflux RND transporter permease subunit [Aliihoeflea sp. 40Bstr573]|uniref:efflux RND transporter permease subunit n=1 Tax=Aliihoeflea sp. 40Bstr573 TaxID=2696467 RepID=UPI002094E442|nr:efflux RND transporter permease subunit [Aliihoeflea sp. 40Bstr573]MCO6389340.1 AcrB/AcrD/AcrF family protein [Aliihoeflea sp. 40Bstr573]
MKKERFNLSDWAIGHASLVWYFMIAFVVAGGISYLNLGREEDPSFTIKTMVIQTQWPGASAQETALQVTDRIERKMQQIDTLDFTRSMTTAGQSIVFVNLKDDTPAAEVPQTWQQVRNLMQELAVELPQGVVGPFFDDRFGDVYGSVYALTGDGLTWRQLRDHAEDLRSAIVTVPNIGRVEIVGDRKEVVWLEFSTRRIAALGLDQQSIVASLREQNAVVPSGVIQAGPERIALRLGGHFTSEESLRAINLRVNDRFFPLTDVATIRRGYQDPPPDLFRFDGEPAIALAISMKAGANLLEFGAALEAVMANAARDLPLGAAIHKVSDQPQVVDHAVSGFTTALFEAVAIVLAISFVSLGLRAGMVVAISIPLTLAITFLGMEYLGISLQRVSLGALIIALGLLVDDAMIAVEMMVARLEVGDTLRKAATYVYTSTAFPMLTGTLVTVAGFIPIGLNDSLAGQFAGSMFTVIAISLVVSWVVAVVFTPLLGVTMLPKTMKHHAQKKGRIAGAFSKALIACLRWRWATIGLTVAAFFAAAASMAFVQVQLFPPSDRAELVVNFDLPHGSTIAETGHQMAQLEDEVLKGDGRIDHWSTYVGRGAMRFLLTLDPPAPHVSMGQIVVVTKGLDVRDAVRADIQEYVERTFIGTDVDIRLLEIGPPIGIPVQYRVSGPDIQTVREHAQAFANVLDAHPDLGRVTFDWMEPARAVRVELFQDKARQLGVTSQDIATILNSIMEGAAVTQIRDGINLVDVVGRASAEERGSLETLRNLQLPAGEGRSIPLGAIATLRYEMEQPVVWQRSRMPTLTVRAEVTGEVKPLRLMYSLRETVASFEKGLPAGYTVTAAGEWEESFKTLMPVVGVIPLMLIVMATILMIQLQSFSHLFLVFTTAPLAVIGVALALVPTGAPLGFIAVLGILALAGILIRNSVILIDRIEVLKAAGKPAWDAVIEATDHRMRPIVLTAAAASLALIPISREVFWGPMAYAMMGGIIVGTALTLLFLPALYVTWFGIRETETVEARAE